MRKKIIILHVLLVSAALFLHGTIPFRIIAETYDAFIYEINEGNAEITGYTDYSTASLTIPNSIGDYPVTALSSSSFEGHSELTEVVIPETVTAIGDNTFNNCSELKTVTFSGSPKLKTIGDNAFYGCVSLNGLTLPEGLQTIGTGAFFMNAAMESIRIPSSVESIGDYAFATVSKQSMGYTGIVTSSLQEVIFEEGSHVTILSKKLFQNDEQLKKIDLPAGLIEIKDRAFQNCALLSTISIPSSVTTIGAYAFSGCASMTSINTKAKVISDYAFADCTNITSVSLPSAETIGVGAFRSIGQALSSEIKVTFELGSAVSSIAEGAFSKNALANFTIDPANTLFFTDSVELGLYQKTTDKGNILLAVAGKYENSEVINGSYSIAQETYRIGNEAFLSETLKLDSLTIPVSVTEIGTNALAGCFSEKAESLTVPGTLTSIGTGAFSHNYNLTTISLTTTITELPDELFYNNTALKTIAINDNNLTAIGSRCFAGNEALEWQIPDTIETIGIDAFDLTCCESITWGSNFTLENGILYHGTTLVQANPKLVQDTLTVKEGTTSILDHALTFSETQNGTPKVIYIPSTVTSIGTEAVGYTFTDRKNGYNLASSVMIISDGDTANSYASANDIACFSSLPSPDLSDITLSQGETAFFTLDAAKTDVFLTSSDSHIASVDSASHQITGVSKGETTVIASTGSCYYKRKVIVTDGTYTPDTSKENTWYQASRDGIENWETEYAADNPQSTSTTLNFSAVVYSGDSYMPMTGLHYLKGHSDENYLISKVYPNPLWGHDINEFQMMNNNLDREMVKGTNENLIVYSGTDLWNLKHMIGGTSLDDVMDAKGTVFTFNCMISTSLDHKVATSFAGTSGNSLMLEIYLPAGYDIGTYIAAISVNPQETELLLKSGIRFQVIDSGVREITYTALKTYEPETSTVTERYLKLLALKPGQEMVTDFDPYIKATAPAPTPTPSASPDPTPTPTITPEPTPTVTPTPTATPTPTISPTPTHTPVPTVTSSASSAPESTATPGTTVVTCQDAGFPAGWYWNETKKACVAPVAATPGTENTAGAKPNTSPSAAPAASTNSSGEEPEVSADTTATPESSPSATADASLTPESTTPPIEIINTKGPLWFLGIPILMIISGLLIYMTKRTNLIPWILVINAAAGILLAVMDHSIVAWILLVLNLAASGLLALYRRSAE